MTTRSIKQLLQLLLDNQQLFITGICHWRQRLYILDFITLCECDLLMKHLDSNLPPKMYGAVGEYSWPPFKIEPRIAWIETQIKLLS